jgi:dihydrodipicolinate synthase/N-acetylneuraminate lyase
MRSRTCSNRWSQPGWTLSALSKRLEPVWALFRAHGSYRVMHTLAARRGIPGAAPPRPVLPLAGEVAREVARVAETHLEG